MILDTIYEKYNNIQGDFYFESFKSDPSIPSPHYHENYEIYFLISGKCRYSFPDKSFELLPGEAIVIEPYIPHRAIYDSYESNNVRFLFNVHPRFLSQYFSDKVVESFFENIEGSTTFKLSKEQCSLFLKYAKELDNDIKKKSSENSYIYIGSILALLSQINQHAEKSNIPKREIANIDKIIDYMNTHIDMPSLTLDTIEKRLFINKNTINALFKKQLNTTPSAYLTNLRIQNAVFLLTKSNYSIAKIAVLCGFSSQMYFTKIFKSTTGITPSQFRKQLNEPKEEI